MKYFKNIFCLLPFFFIPFLLDNRPYYIFYSTDVEVDYFWSAYSLYSLGISNSFSHPGFIVQSFGALILFLFSNFIDIYNIQENINILRYISVILFVIALLYMMYRLKYDIRIYTIIVPLISTWIAIYPALLYFSADSYALIISVPICMTLARKLIISSGEGEINIPFIALITLGISIKVIFAPFLLIYAIILSGNKFSSFKFLTILFYASIFFIFINIYQYNLFIEFGYKTIFKKILPLLIVLFLIILFFNLIRLNLKDLALKISKLFIILNLFLINPILYLYSFDWSLLRNITPFYLLSIFIFYYSIKNVNFKINYFKILLINIFIILFLNIFFAHYNKIITAQKFIGAQFKIYLSDNFQPYSKILYWPGSGDHGITQFDFVSWGWYRYVEKSVPPQFVDSKLYLIPLRQFIKNFKDIEFPDNEYGILKKIKNFFVKKSTPDPDRVSIDIRELSMLIKCNELSNELIAQGINPDHESNFIKYILNSYGVLDYDENVIRIGGICWKIYNPILEIK